jgi:hypothetical protein
VIACVFLGAPLRVDGACNTRAMFDRVDAVDGIGIELLTEDEYMRALPTLPPHRVRWFPVGSRAEGSRVNSAGSFDGGRRCEIPAPVSAATDLVRESLPRGSAADRPRRLSEAPSAPAQVQPSSREIERPPRLFAHSTRET